MKPTENKALPKTAIFFSTFQQIHWWPWHCYRPGILIVKKPLSMNDKPSLNWRAGTVSFVTSRRRYIFTDRRAREEGGTQEL